MDDQPTQEMPGLNDPGETVVMPEVPSGGQQPTPPTGAPPQTPPSAPSGAGGTPSGGDRTKLLVAIIVIILLVGVGVAGSIWQKRKADDAEDRIAQLEQQVEDLASGDADDTTDGDADADAADDPSDDAADDPDPDADGDADDGDTTTAPDAEDGEYIGKITDIYNIMQSRWIEIDFIQFLSGQEAADAAAAAGDESPPPNDYYIVNENPKLRDFNVREGLQVTMWTWNIETEGVTEQQIPFDIWWDAIEMAGQTQYLAVPYWIIVDNGTVIDIEEQYLP